MWYYVYILELNNGKHYVGCTINLKERFTRHKKGYVPATKGYLPIKLIWCCSFPDRYKAYEFERYLKSGSGRAFATKHLFWNLAVSVEFPEDTLFRQVSKIVSVIVNMFLLIL